MEVDLNINGNVIKKCPNCFKNLIKNQNKFCDKECYTEYRFLNDTLPRFKEGKVLWNKTLKNILIYLNGEQCSNCKQPPKWNGKILTLQVDHVDGNSDNCFPDNLRLLCPNCHSQTETYGWKGEVKETSRNKYLRKYKK